MEKKPVEVLVVAPLGVGGVSTMMINIQKHINRENVNFDYLVFHEGKAPSEDIVRKMGSRKLIACVDHFSSAVIRRFARLAEIKRVCKENNIKILHYNADTPADLMNVIAAKAGGVEYVTMHSHNGGFGNAGLGIRFFSFILKPLMPVVCDTFLSCSNLAANFMYPKNVIKSKKYMVLHNGIDLDKFAYNEKIRKEKRLELDLENKFVIGHAGRFSNQKNHAFIIDIFSKICEKDTDSVLLLFGAGELQEKMKLKAKELGIYNRIIFYGTSDEMFNMWQAVDVFLMPSLHEGLPVTGIEAQASGVPCVFSDEITKEVDVSNTSIFLSLSRPVEEWAETVLSFKGKNRLNNIDLLKKAKYDIAETANIVEKLYLDASKSI